MERVEVTGRGRWMTDLACVGFKKCEKEGGREFTAVDRDVIDI